MRIGYADPPYVGMARKHYKDHPDYAGEVDHVDLIDRLERDYEAWVLHLHVPSLRDLLPLTPIDTRLLVWVKTFAVFKKHVPLAHAWEPILVRSRRARGVETVRDWISAPITLKQGVAGAKPDKVSFWLFDAIGAEPTDQLDDLFPGSGAVGSAWQRWQRQVRIPAFDSIAVFSESVEQPELEESS